MALARVTIWVAGQILTAAALNGEFNNIINNPLTLLSPTTGNINFSNNQALSFGLEKLASQPVAANAGRIYFNTATKQIEVDDGTIIRTAPTTPISSAGYIVVGASSGDGSWKNIVPGTSGQVATITAPGIIGWAAVPASTQGLVLTSQGGTGKDFSTANPGSILVVTSSAVGVFKELQIGSTGQVLTVTSSSGILAYATPAASGASGGGGFTSSSVTFYDTFQSLVVNQTNQFIYAPGDTPAAGLISQAPTGGLKFGSSGSFQISNTTAVQSGAIPLFLTSLQPDMTLDVLTTALTIRRIGLLATAANTEFSSDPTNGLYFRTTGLASTWFAVSRNAGTSFTIATTAVGSSAFQTLRIQVTSSGIYIISAPPGWHGTHVWIRHRWRYESCGYPSGVAGHPE
jgi:hypothetical protein